MYYISTVVFIAAASRAGGLVDCQHIQQSGVLLWAGRVVCAVVQGHWQLHGGKTVYQGISVFVLRMLCYAQCTLVAQEPTVGLYHDSHVDTLYTCTAVGIWIVWLAWVALLKASVCAQQHSFLDMHGSFLSGTWSSSSLCSWCCPTVVTPRLLSCVPPFGVWPRQAVSLQQMQHLLCRGHLPCTIFGV